MNWCGFVLATNSVGFELFLDIYLLGEVRRRPTYVSSLHLNYLSELLPIAALLNQQTYANIIVSFNLCINKISIRDEKRDMQEMDKKQDKFFQ